MKEERLMSLPLHHIDTSVILETRRTENGRYCRRYLQLVGYKYKGIVPFPALSEIFSVALTIEDYNRREDFLEVIYQLFKDAKIDTYVSKNMDRISLQIENIDSRIRGSDRWILASSIEANASALVTLDKELLENSKIEHAFGIKIMHPKDLL